MSVYGERIVRVETELVDLRKAFEDHKLMTNVRFAEISTKLDLLLALRNKGMGIVWLFSGLFGTGFVAGMIQLSHYIWSK